MLQPADVPETLCDLALAVVAALRPLDVDAGRYENVPHGYRVHSSMIRFAWADGDAVTKIAQLAKSGSEACSTSRSSVQLPLSHSRQHLKTAPQVFRGQTQANRQSFCRLM